MIDKIDVPVGEDTDQGLKLFIPVGGTPASEAAKQSCFSDTIKYLILIDR